MSRVWEERLDRLASYGMEDSMWACRDEVFTNVRRFLTNYYHEFPVDPAIVLSGDGGIVLEWIVDRVDFTLEFEAEDSFYWHVLDLDSRENLSIEGPVEMLFYEVRLWSFEPLQR